MIDNDTTPLAHDYLDLDSLFSAEELALRDRVRAFVAERIRPNIAGWYEAAHFPREIANDLDIDQTFNELVAPVEVRAPRHVAPTATAR